MFFSALKLSLEKVDVAHHAFCRGMGSTIGTTRSTGRAAWQAEQQCRLGSLFERTPRGESPSADIEAQHGKCDQQSSAPGEHLPVGVGAHRDWKMTNGRFAIGAFRLVLQNWLLSAGKEQRCGLAGNPGDREHDARHHPWIAAR